ncbi:two-component system sensor histidine kinase NtrB [Gemmatimonas phototrophica]|nr:ATP-binding protein [Gemmatimonas phototrophica]
MAPPIPLRSACRFRAIFVSALQGQLLLDVNGTCLEVNPAALQVVGAKAADVIDVPLPLAPWFTGLPDAQRSVAHHLGAASTGNAVRFETETHLLDGRIGLLEVSITPASYADGAVGTLLCEMRDVTERRRSEDALREIGALTTIGRLSARVAHEINNPLAGIQNAFLLLADAVPQSHPHYLFLQAIDDEIQRIARVTRSLYETYQFEAPPDAPSNLALAVKDAVAFLDQVNRRRAVRITTELRGAPALVPVPDALLRQTLYNLVQNAVEASPVGGEVRLSITTEDDHCVIRVEDDGMRVPDHLRDLIFQPMSGERHANLRTGSMGIGLSLVHQSVQAIGGTVTLLNSTGHGATFVVRLPMTSVLQPLELARTAAGFQL